MSCVGRDDGVGDDQEVGVGVFFDADEVEAADFRGCQGGDVGFELVGPAGVPDALGHVVDMPGYEWVFDVDVGVRIDGQLVVDLG